MHTLDLNVSVCREGKAELFLKVKFNFTPVLLESVRSISI